MGSVCTINGKNGPECTDNFQIVSPPFSVDGNKFHSAEQAYQASKFSVGSEAFQRILNADPANKTKEQFGMEVWMIGNSCLWNREFEAIKVKSMYVANLCKFSQNPTLASELRSTRGKIEAAASTWRWQFFNSRILQRIRYLLESGDIQQELERITLLDGKSVEQELEFGVVKR
jgi:predicted NAD-dependent protein-ADP-ribosyltransferase YbiA (DUF1768 family)